MSDNRSASYIGNVVLFNSDDKTAQVMIPSLFGLGLIETDPWTTRGEDLDLIPDQMSGDRVIVMFDGGDISSQAYWLPVFNGVVRTGAIEIGPISPDMLADGFLLPIDKLIPGSVAAAQIAANAVVADKIAAGAVVASKLATNAIMSTNYSHSSGTFSSAGSFLNLADGTFRTPGLFVDGSSGNVQVSGVVTATALAVRSAVSASTTIMNVAANAGPYGNGHGFTLRSGGNDLKNGSLWWSRHDQTTSRQVGLSAPSNGSSQAAFLFAMNGSGVSQTYLQSNTSVSSVSALNLQTQSGLTTTTLRADQGINSARIWMSVPSSGDSTMNINADVVNVTGLTTASVPNLPASKITSGQFNPNRIPSGVPWYVPRTYTNTVGSGNCQIMWANDSRLRFRFGGTSVPQGIRISDYENIAVDLNRNGDVWVTGDYKFISDAREKQDIVDGPSQLDTIRALRFVNYRRIIDVEEHGDDAEVRFGVVAQEAQQVCPDLVDERDGGTLGVSGSELYMRAVKALQELAEMVDSIAARIEALEAA